MKYIDSEKLIAEIERRKKSIDECPFIEAEFGASIKRDVKIETFNELISLITSLQQEQREASNNLVDVDAVREDFIREVYRVLDADPTNDRANAIINAFDSLPTVSREQPKVDLEKEIARFALNGGTGDNTPTIGETARHFYELGLNARKEE